MSGEGAGGCGRRAAMLSRWLCGAAGPLPVVTGPGLGEFYADHAVLGTALINQLPAPRGSRFHKTVTAPTCTPYCVPTPGLLSCAVPGLGATAAAGRGEPPKPRGVVCMCVLVRGWVGRWGWNVCIASLSCICPSVLLPV